MTKKKAPTPSQIAQHLLTLRAAQSSFTDFVRFMKPEWELAPFQLDLINTLDLFEKDELLNEDGQPIHNLLVTMPPRMAKSTFCTQLFPAYFMARDPARFTMSCSYNAALAVDFGREVRAIAEDPKTQQVFPDFSLLNESRAVDAWVTSERGKYFAVGIGGTTSGRPANLLILDDPIKSRSEAESITQRNRTWNYYASALTMRLEPDHLGRPPKTIIVLTRWHPDDVAGRLMETDDWAEGRWKHINYEGIITDAEGNETSLWPERFPLETLQRRRRLSPREFASLYQQQPYIEGGNIIRSDWWQYLPADLIPERFASLIVACDTAFKSSELSDFSVAVTAGIDFAGDIHIIDVVKGRYEFPALKQRLIQLNARLRPRGLRAIYVEDKASGQSIIQELKRVSGLSVIPYKVVHDKVARVNAILPIIEGGRVFLPQEAPWLDEFMDEMVAFPAGTHDDQVDATTMAIDILSRTGLAPSAEDLFSDLGQSLASMDDQSLNLGQSLNSKLNTSRRWQGWGL